MPLHLAQYVMHNLAIPAITRCGLRERPHCRHNPHQVSTGRPKTFLDRCRETARRANKCYIALGRVCQPVDGSVA